MNDEIIVKVISILVGFCLGHIVGAVTGKWILKSYRSKSDTYFLKSEVPTTLAKLYNKYYNEEDDSAKFYNRVKLPSPCNEFDYKLVIKFLKDSPYEYLVLFSDTVEILSVRKEERPDKSVNIKISLRSRNDMYLIKSLVKLL